MKSWLHSHRIRKQRSESHLLPIQRDSTNDVTGSTPKRPPPLQLEGAKKIAISSTSSRISIERYLSAPLEDEPASVPAINAALQRQNSQKGNIVPAPSRTVHSRESSYDANSDGRRTFYTSGSAPTSTGTSYSVARAGAHQRNASLPDVPELPKAEQLEFMDAKVGSPERPTTSGTVDMEKTWAEQMEKFMPGYERESQVDYKAKADLEISRIQEKARELEEEMRRFKAEREASSPELVVSRVTDEMAYAQMAARPKLAWILGGDIADTKSIERPKSSGSALTNTSDAERPGSSHTMREEPTPKAPRRTRSSGALDEKARQGAVNARPDKRAAGLFDRKPSRRPKFFCTFCQKRFHSRVEWMRHEETIHMPEELWVCCPRIGEFPERCPFCAKHNPSPSHLADHNYLSCQKKPLSERTFNRKDHFLQHISQEHKVSPSQKPVRLTELLEAWKHPLPLKEGHQALHCGFCGKTFPTYKERRDHVGQHFLEGRDMMSWWNARVSHDIPHPKPSEAMHRNPDVPYRCNYCERTYANLATAQKLHPVCTMWSCSFLPGMQYTIYPAGSREDLQAVCCYCNETLVRGSGRVKGSILRDHINQHNFRNCNQRLYFSGQRFRQHLQDNHKSSYDGTLLAGWTLLLKSSRREKPAIFEPVDPTSTAAIRRAYTDPGSEPAAPANKHKKGAPSVPEMPKMNFMDLSETPLRSTAPRKRLRRKPSAQTMPEKDAPREIRESKNFFTRAATIDLAYNHNHNTSSPSSSSSPNSSTNKSSSNRPNHTHHRPTYPVQSLPMDAVTTCPVFYRRRLDASTRNRVYIKECLDGGDREKELGKNTARLFRRVEGSAFGGLVLRSSMLGAVPARMTNGVDVYSLH